MKRIPRISRILLAAAALLLGLTFAFPLWKISLWAPQYPEGLSFSIWSFQFTGDVQTVNVLNHYIGMQPIAKESFPELEWFPKAFAALLGTGLLAALVGRRILAWAWTATLLGFASWSLYDFYAWGYRFGHELSPDAPIKMEDMVYQPPLIGSKEFLNIVADSWPDIAGIGFTFAIFFAVVAVILDARPGLFSRIRPGKGAAPLAATLGLLVLSAGSLTGCTQGKAQPIDFGVDSCSECRMKITDRRFGGEVISSKGKVAKFDSLECMNRFLHKHSDEGARLFVVDASRSGELVPASGASFFLQPGLRSPMGQGILASDDTSRLRPLLNERAGEPSLYKWEQLRSEILTAVQ